MFKTFTIFISLFSFSFVKYISMGQKEEDIDIDDICYYKDPKDLMNNDDDIEYVKPCETNYYCRQISGTISVGTCEKYSQVIKKLDEDCNSNYECEQNLVCDKAKCIIQNNTASYHQVDLAIRSSNNDYYYCPSYSIPIKISSSSYECKKSEEEKMNEMCLITLESGTQKEAFPDYFKVCGKQAIIKENGKYNLKNTTANYIGSIPNGNFVDDIRACESGFALLFYGDGNTTMPDTTQETADNMFKMCVEVNEAREYQEPSGSVSCYINYTLGEKSYIYNTRKVHQDALSIYSGLFDKCQFIMTKINLFKEYTTAMNEIKEEICENVRFYDEPFTCGNDKLRKLWYYYNNVEEYLLYKNDEDISKYLIQNAYPLYGFEVNETDNKDSSIYLNIKYFIVLLFLLSL